MLATKVSVARRTSVESYETEPGAAEVGSSWSGRQARQATHDSGSLCRNSAVVRSFATASRDGYGTPPKAYIYNQETTT